MATSQVNEFMHYLRRTVLLPDGAGLTDGQLLGRFLELRDEDAFAALIKRHGPMVWGVCRRLLTNQQDAEDAFQATFLVLVRKAATVLPRERVANWLYGVASMTAHRGKVAAARARRRERQVTEMPEPAVVEPDLWRDLQPLLDQEMSFLPDTYREAIVLCDLEGKARKEVARQLGLPEGTVASRLARARTMLAKRLTRRGLAVSGGTLAAVVTEKASASVPCSLVSSTIKAVTLVTAGQAAATGAISVKVATLMEGVLRAMFLTKLKIAGAVVLIAVSLTSGAGLICQTRAAQDATGREQPGLSPQRADEPASEKGDKTPELLRRVEALEKQIQALTSEVRALQKNGNTSTAQTPAKTEVKTFLIQHGSVDAVAQTLWDLYRSKTPSDRPRIATNGSTNTLIVVASPNDLGVIETIVTQLERLPRKAQNKGKAEK